MYNDSYTTPFSHPAFCNAVYYEMLANHTLPKLSPGDPRIAGDSATNAAFFSFVVSVEPLFGARTPIEDVGVYYSSSTLLRQHTPGDYLNFNAQPHQCAFWGWTTALGELHYQYRALPEWKLTRENLDSLAILVIPDAEVLDPMAVTEVLQPWVEAGGRLVITGDTGKFLGETGNFDPNPDGLSVAPLLNNPNVTYLPEEIGLDYFLAYVNRPSLLPQFAQAMDSARAKSRPLRLVATNAPSTAGLTLHQDAGTKRLCIDVNNLQIDETSWQLTPTGPIEMELRPPAWLSGNTIHATVVSPQSPAPTATIETTANGTLRISLGPVTEYAGIVISMLSAREIRRNEDQTVTVSFSGIPGVSYDVERSTGLEDWEPVATLSAASDGGFEYTDRAASGIGSIFYRARAGD
jgi:hypothetical protein